MLIERIKLLCKEKNISIRKLEQEAGLSSGSIGKWLKSSPSLDALQKIARFFGVSLDYLVGNSECRVPLEQLDFFHNDIGLIKIAASTQADIQQRLESILIILAQAENVIFGGELMDSRTKELFTISLENLLENTQKKFIIKKCVKKQ